jgi:hypothetical protein
LKTAHTGFASQHRNRSGEEYEKHTKHEEAKGIVIFRRISTAIRLSDPEERRNDDPKSKIEQPEGTENSVGVGVAENDLPLSRNHHSDACDTKEVADECIGDGHASPSH